MNLENAVEGQSIKPAQFLQIGSVLLLAMAASLLLAFRQHNRLTLALAAEFWILALPATYVVTKKRKAKSRQHETERRLMVHTKLFLSTQEAAPLRIVEPDPETLGERLLTALRTDGSALAPSDFQAVHLEPAPPSDAAAALFIALPRVYAVRRLYERRISHLAATLPAPVAVPLGENLATLEPEPSAA